MRHTDTKVVTTLKLNEFHATCLLELLDHYDSVGAGTISMFTTIAEKVDSDYMTAYEVIADISASLEMSLQEVAAQ